MSIRHSISRSSNAAKLALATFLVWSYGIQLNSAESPPTIGTISVLYMRLAFPNDLSEPIGETEALNHMSQVDAWYQAHSYGQFSISTTVTPLLILPEPKDWYSSELPGTLLDHARAAAATAGFDSLTYDLDIARFNPITGPSWNFSGTSKVGGRNLLLQATQLGLTIHELGHNLGLDHANRWEPSAGTSVGPGSNVPYENVYDTMGLPLPDPSAHHFNVAWKHRLGWIPSTSVARPEYSGVVRLWAYDVDALEDNRLYAINLAGTPVRDYWIEFRQSFVGDPLTQNGLIFNLGPWPGSGRDSQLLDMTPLSADGIQDAPLVLGRSYSDWESELHVTPLAVGTEGAARWIDVHVQLGNDPANQVPTLSLSASTTTINSGESVDLTALANDPDGDSLAYHWDFSDNELGENQPIESHSWSIEGEYLVTCTVSDMRGGTSSESIIVVVGSPNTYQISGFVTELGAPLGGATILVDGVPRAISDSDGNYTVTDLPAGDYVVDSFSPGRTLTGSGFSNPVSLSSESANGIDFNASPNGPSFARAPESESLNPGDNVVLYALVSGLDPIYYQWQLDGADLPGATKSALQLSNISSSDAGEYELVAWNSVATNTSPAAVVSVRNTPIIVTQPEDQVANPGDSVTFTVTATSALFYGWFYNTNQFISDSNTDQLTITDVSAEDAGTYMVRVVNSFGQVDSRHAVLRINQPPSAQNDYVDRYPQEGTYIAINSLLTNDSDPDNDTVELSAFDQASPSGGTISETGEWLRYIPQPGNSDPDSFNYTIRDEFGATATATVEIGIKTEPFPTPQLTIEPLPSNNIRIWFNAVPGATYGIEYAEELPALEWFSLGSETATPVGMFMFTNARPAGATSRFFRTVYP